MTLLEFLGSFLTGGVAGSAITAWVGWDIKKRELRFQQRRQNIENWRTLIASLPDEGGWSPGGPKERKIITSQAFASLEPHLDDDLLKKLRNERTVVVGSDFPRRQLSEVVGRLEKQWKLV